MGRNMSPLDKGLIKLGHSNTNELGVTLKRISQNNLVKVRLINVITSKCQVTVSGKCSRTSFFLFFFSADDDH